MLLQEREPSEIQRIARARRATVAEWMRRTLRAAARHALLTGGIDQVLEEVERGYFGPSSHETWPK